MRSGFIVVAACVMTFEARDSAAKVVPARFKMSATGPPSVQCTRSAHVQQHVGHSVHGSLRTSASQTGTTQQHVHATRSQADRRTITQSFMQFSRGLALDAHNRNINTLNIQVGKFLYRVLLFVLIFPYFFISVVFPMMLLMKFNRVQLIRVHQLQIYL